MKRNKIQKFENIIREHKSRKVWRIIAMSLGAVVMFVTAYILINPASAQKVDVFCGYEEHKVHDFSCYDSVLVCTLPTEGHIHTEACVEEVKTLICTLEEGGGHTHTEECYLDEAQLVCSVEETDGHLHNENCYTTESILICENTEEGHVHDETCFETSSTLICTQPEVQPHHHDGSCYEIRQVLSCGQEEVIAHQHDDNCYQIETRYICGLDESEPHTHGEECYAYDETAPICGLPIHEHTLQCFSDPNADIETEEIWMQTMAEVELTGHWREDVLLIAESQLGYHESEKNYFVKEDGVTMMGRSRYGEWYGEPYSEWSAKFVAFCQHYAGVDSNIFPTASDCGEWIGILKSEPYGFYHAAEEMFAAEAPTDTEAAADIAASDIEGSSDNVPDSGSFEGVCLPEAGDLLFLDTDAFDPAHPEERTADRVLIVTEFISDEESGIADSLKVIGQNADGAVSEAVYTLNDPAILGFAEFPEKPAAYRSIESAPASDGAVAVITGILPDYAEAKIEAVTLSADELIAYFGAEKAATMDTVAAYDIKIMVGDEEWQPDASVNVVVRQAEIVPAENETFAAAHVDGLTNEVEEIGGELSADGEISFNADGFSLYIFYTFTVDFHYGDLTFGINGMDSILLSELLNVLNIDVTVDRVLGVTFSDPSLIAVEAVDGDWKLTSLAAFSTSETLKLLLVDGSELVINVTDAQTTVRDKWILVTDKSQFVEGEKYVIVGKDGSNRYHIMGYAGAANPSGSNTPLTITPHVSGNYLFNTVVPDNQQWSITTSGEDLIITTRYETRDYYVAVTTLRFIDNIPSVIGGNYTADASVDFGGSWTFSNTVKILWSKTYYLSVAKNGSSFESVADDDTYSKMWVFMLKDENHDLEADENGNVDVWYHDGSFYTRDIFTENYEVRNLWINDTNLSEAYLGATDSHIFTSIAKIGSSAAPETASLLDFMGRYNAQNPTGPQFNQLTVHMASTYPIAAGVSESFGCDAADLVTPEICLVRDPLFENSGALLDVPSTAGTGVVIGPKATIDNATAVQGNTAVKLSGNTLTLEGTVTNSGAAAPVGTGIQISGGGSLLLQGSAVIENQLKGIDVQSGTVCLGQPDSTTPYNIRANSTDIILTSGSVLQKNASDLSAIGSASDPITVTLADSETDSWKAGDVILSTGLSEVSVSDVALFMPVKATALTEVCETEYETATGTSSVIRLAKNLVYNETDACWYPTLYDAVNDTAVISDGDTIVFFGNTDEIASVTIQNSITVRSASASNDSDAAVASACGKTISADGYQALWSNAGTDGCVVVTNGATASFGGTGSGSLTFNANGTGRVIDLDEAAAANLAANFAVTGGAAADGAGVYIESGAALSLQGAEISGNTATANGGGVYAAAGGVFTVSSGKLENNAAVNGGGIYVVEGGVLNVTSGSIMNNTATAYGSAVYQNGKMNLSGAPLFGENDIYLPCALIEDSGLTPVITKAGDFTFTTPIHVTLGGNQYKERNYVESETDALGVATNAVISDDLQKFTLTNVAADVDKVFTRLDNLTGVPVLEIKGRTSLFVTKKWEGEPPAGTTIRVGLYSTDPNVTDELSSAVLSAANGWTCTFAGLVPPAEDGTIPYYVQEEPVEGYVSTYSEVLYSEGVSEAWVPADPNNFTAGGSYLIYMNSGYLLTGSGTTLSVTKQEPGGRVILGNKVYESNFKVSDIAATKQWQATSVTGGFRLRANNGSGYYLRYYNSAFSLNSSNSSVVQIANTHVSEQLDLVTLKVGSVHAYVQNGALKGASSAVGSSDEVTLYEKVTSEETGPGSYTVTITNHKVTAIDPANPQIDADPEVHKRIDFLGHGAENTDTSLVGGDMYRLYLDLMMSSKPVDLCLVVDYSSSMSNTSNKMAGEYGDDQLRCAVLDSVINGSVAKGTNVTSSNSKTVSRMDNGIIYKFLTANPKNEMCFIKFYGSAQALGNNNAWVTPTTTTTGIWKTASNLIGTKDPTDPKSYVVDVMSTGSNTNYQAGLQMAINQFANKWSDGRKKVLIFLTDGAPETGQAGASQWTQLCAHSDLTAYVVGVSDAVTQANSSERTLLTNMAAEAGTEFLPANDFVELRNSLNAVIDGFTMMPMTLNDELSSYVEFAPQRDFQIELIDVATGASDVIWDESGEKTDKNILNGGRIVTDVQFTDDKATVSFNTDLKIKDEKRISVSYNIETTSQGYRETVLQGGYGTTEGDEGTDYDESDITSSGRGGLYANNRADLAFVSNDEYYSIEYPHPVVQVPNATITLRKVSTNSRYMPLGGSSFDLYLKSESTETGAVSVPGVTGAYGKKVNTEPYTTDISGEAAIRNITFGDYYLIETASPTGYSITDGTMAFNVSESGITVQSGDIYVNPADKTLMFVGNEPDARPADTTKLPKDIASVTGSKRIDWLGDNDGTNDNENPDTALDDTSTAGLENTYRLYLDLKEATEATDLLLVIDNSDSMDKQIANGVTRRDAVSDFLNGTATDHSDGFIHQFLSQNSGNSIAAITFGTDSNFVSSAGGDYILPWTNDATATVTLSADEETTEGTNYAAGLYTADKILKQKSGSNPKYVIFLTDGVPTYAYEDGLMHNTAMADSPLVGNGSDSSEQLSWYTYYSIWLDGCLETAAGSITTPFEYDTTDFMNQPVTDHAGNTVSFPANYVPLDNYATYGTQKTYPIFYRLTDAVMDESLLPGVKLKDGTFDGRIEITDLAKLQAAAAYYASFSDPDKLMSESSMILKSVGEKIDIFDLSKSAFDDFMTANEDVNVITVGFSNEFSTVYTDAEGIERSAEEVVKYYGLHGGDNGGYIRAGSASELKEAISGFFMPRKVVLTDALSDYVDLHSTPELKITKQGPADTEPVTLWGFYGSTIQNDGIIKQAAFTDDGLTVTFEEGYALEGDTIYQASFNIRTSTTADSVYASGGYPMSMVGEDGTDYGDNISSSGAPGFYSNELARVVWGKGVGTETAPQTYFMNYDHPVVQVHGATFNMVLKKVDSTDGTITLAGAEFDLYQKCGESVANSILLTDVNGEQHHCILRNTAPISPLIDTGVLISGLSAGEYFLVETKEPVGYLGLTAPISFKLESTGIITSDKNVIVNGTGNLTLCVKNTSGYALPETGGIGTGIYMICGFFCMIAAVLLYAVMAGRKKIRRSE